MESIPVDMDKNAEELTGRKKSRFKQLKTRLFGKLKKKESEGLIKQSQSTSDITAPDGRREGDDSEDEFTYPQGLSPRALSHDSIFFTDQTQTTEPTRVLSQENVHGKIKALQLKLQQQNLHLGPPPMLIPGKRTEDSGATSEDDGLPCSPPETYLYERVMHGAAYKYPEPRKHLSSLSLAGTGSEEEEQGDPFQSSSRPLSPVYKPSFQPIICSGSALATPTAGADFSSPASYTPTLDNSAARHRMSVKPRNQRASTRGNRGPTVSISPRQRSESISDLDSILSEKDDDDADDDDDGIMTSTVTVHHLSHSPPTLEIKEETTIPGAPETSVQIQEEKEEKLSKPLDVEILKSEESLEPEGKLTMNPLYLQPMTFGSGPPSPSGLPELSLREAESFIQKDDMNDIQIVAKESMKEEPSFRFHPVPLPRTKKPKVDPPSPKASAESVSLQFLLASAKNRSRTISDTKQNEGDLNMKTQSINSNLEVLKDEEKETKPLENLLYRTQDTKSIRREAPAPAVMSKPAGANVKKSDLSAENVESEKLEEPEERRIAFGVHLRTTSLSLKYRSEVSRMKDETKRYSLESNTALATSEEHAGKAEVFRGTCDSSFRSKPKKQDAQSLETQLATQDYGRSSIQNTTGTSKEAEPDWMSLAREKTRAYQPLMSRFSTNQSSVQPSVQPPKPALQPKTLTLTTTALQPLKTQPIQTSSQQSVHKPAVKPTPAGTKDKPDNSRNNTTEDDTTKRAATISKMDPNARPVPPNNNNTEAPTIPSEPPASSSSPSSSSPADVSGAQPSWMELAKRKSLAWSDKKTLE
ncbi:CRACD-like protein [Danio aesculapii]|uniref:CRACD-like protein n=1 Tax=Danio aesculapii TaxID=1142201 RepID=UPI0024BFEF0F|nr:CRACD-like protein [Danio aesculapii]XP_056312536.1 CRACD-like protein [Danio aesculapii]